MRRMRRAVPWSVALSLICLGAAMGADAVGGPPQPSIVTELAQWIVGNVIALCGIFVAATRATQVWLKGHVAAVLALHDGGKEVHQVASAHNHGPMTDQMNRIEKSLDAICNNIRTLIEGQKVTATELSDLDTRLCGAESKLTTLCAEHNLLHGSALRKRQEDGEVDIERLRSGRQ